MTERFRFDSRTAYERAIEGLLSSDPRERDAARLERTEEQYEELVEEYLLFLSEQDG